MSATMSAALNPMANLGTLAAFIRAGTLVGDPATPVLRVHSDTRSIQAGDLFVALRGERFDANDFLHEAKQRGATAIVCESGLTPDRYPADVPRIEVPETRLALAQCAAAWRAQFSLPLVAVTGSNGKTTVTQMVAAIFEAWQPHEASLATRGNLNNDIGVPLTLLRLRAQHRCAVVELGMNHPGEIARLAALARPTVALVNNAQREHLEFMHTVDAVAQENGCVIDALPSHGTAVFPADDTYTNLWTHRAGARRSVQFRIEPLPGDSVLACMQAQWVHGAWQVHARGMGVDLHYRLAVAGRHNVTNSLAAAACALAAGAPVTAVEQGLAQFAPVKGRSRAMVLQVAGHSLTLVDDTYNANPDSVHAAIDVLADLPGPRLLVLGDMGEVGDDGPSLHAEAGRYARTRGIDHLYGLGALACSATQAAGNGVQFEDVDTLIAATLAALPHTASVLVKGSRFMHMERVVDALTAALPVPGEVTHAA